MSLRREVGLQRLAAVDCLIARVNVLTMSRVLAVATACLLGLCARADADTVAADVHELASADAPYKIRLSAALSLSKSRDARAVIALADALLRDDEATIRRLAAVALEKMIEPRTPDDARALGLEALDRAASSDRDPRVRETAARVAAALSGLRRKSATRPDAPGTKPPVFVNIDLALDRSKKLPNEAAERLTRVVKKTVEGTGYATAWPGGLPTSAELGKSRAFIIASTVMMVDITKSGRMTEISCKLTIRIAPWLGKDGGEHWEPGKAANAEGMARASVGSSDRDVANGMRECIEAVAINTLTNKVLPFLRHVATM